MASEACRGRRTRGSRGAANTHTSRDNLTTSDATTPGEDRPTPILSSTSTRGTRGSAGYEAYMHPYAVQATSPQLSFPTQIAAHFRGWSSCGLDGGWASLVASAPRWFGRRRWAPCACKLPSTACPSPMLEDGATRTRRARPACGSARACCQRRYGSVPSTAAPIVRIPRVARLDTKSCCGW